MALRTATALTRRLAPWRARLTRSWVLLFPRAGNPSTTTAHRSPLSAAPLAFLVLSAFGYVTLAKFTFDPSRPIGTIGRVPDSSGQPAAPQLDDNGLYTEQRKICSPPTASLDTPAACPAPPRSATPNCSRCLEGRCLAITALTLEAPNSRWRFIELPRVECPGDDPESACHSQLLPQAQLFELSTSPSKMHASVYTSGSSVRLRLCATARYYPPWTKKDWEHDPPPLPREQQPLIPALSIGSPPDTSSAGEPRGNRWP
jgi:hypothetical protein